MTAPTEPVLAPEWFEPPLQNPSPYGLYAATEWQPPLAPGNSPEGAAVRHLHGVQFKSVGNYGGSSAFGQWPDDSCVGGATITDELKTGTRPGDPDPFAAATLWAYDECDARPVTRTEVETRVAQVFRLEEQIAFEAEFADRLLEDVTTTGAVTSLKEAVSYLETEVAKTNTVAFFHVSPAWVAREFSLFVRSGTAFRSPLGHLWVIGGGYADTLGDTIVATSPTYGWRNETEVRPALARFDNTYAAVAERTVLVGYEKLIAAVEITLPTEPPTEP